MGELGLWDNWTVLASTVKERAGLLMKMLHMRADADGGGWAVVVADGTNACKENRTTKKEKNKKLTSGT